MSINLRRTVIVALCLAIGIASCSGQAGERNYSLVLGGNQSTEDLVTQGLQLVAELAKKKSNGTISIEVMPASQLGDGITQIEAVGMGTQDMAGFSAGFNATFVADKGPESIFFLFKDAQHLKTYLKSDICTELNQRFLDITGARVLANNWISMPRAFSSKQRPLTSIKDFSGLKIRVPDIKVYLDSITSLGGKSTQVPTAEIYLAFMQGLVDAAEQPYDMLYTLNICLVGKYITRTNHVRDAVNILINEAKFQTMSEGQRKALIEAAVEAGEWYEAECYKNFDRITEMMKKVGCEIFDVPPVDFAEMREAVLKYATKLEADGNWEKGLIERISALAK
ncbi:MAG: TRAP transporter substrate-binding protein [Planctomycetota bacterium]|jgi:TRAP-type C4-dicarboxylate transport system substrate-binding protein|nr:TRAP transporter substrate-binding protein [Planctomycetota bacterium]